MAIARQRSLLDIFNPFQPKAGPEPCVNPAVVETFLPWAFTELNISEVIQIRRSQRVDLKPRQRKSSIFVKTSGKNIFSTGTISQISKSTLPDAPKTQDSAKGTPVYVPPRPGELVIEAVYFNNELEQLKFIKNHNVPCKIFEVLGLIIDYHPHLSSIIINSGLDHDGVAYLRDLISISNITEIILDDCYIPETNFCVLLNESVLSYLSLSRCRLNDKFVKQICETLDFGGTAAKSLKILNLSSNGITDEGAGYIARVLRTNRQLKYLSLADNHITDVGSDAIVSSLGTFELSKEEVREYYRNRMAYLKERQDLIEKYIKELKNGERLNSSKKRKTGKSSKSNKDYEYWYALAKQMATTSLGKIKEPYPISEITISENRIYSYGNNILCCLNLAYNNLTCFALGKINEVLQYQSRSSRYPKGLIRLVLEGNLIPLNSQLREIDELLYESKFSSVTTFIKDKKAKQQTSTRIK